MTVAYWGHVLAPWLTLLIGKLRVRVPALPTRDVMESVWIHFQVADPSAFEPARWTRLIEALQLVDLLIRVDANIGWELLLSVVRCTAVFLENTGAFFRPHTVRPRYELQIGSHDVAFNFQTVFLALRRMIGEDDQPWEPPSPDFPRVQQLLLDAWKRQHNGGDFDRTREGRIEFKLQFCLCTDMRIHPVPFILDHTLGLAQASRTLMGQDQQGPTPGLPTEALQADAAAQLVIRRRRAMFRLVSLDFLILNTPTDQVLSALNWIHGALPVTHLAIDQVTLDQNETIQQQIDVTVNFLWRYLGVAALGIKSFEFSSGGFDRASVVAICSGLAVSESIEDVAFTRSATARADPENVLHRSSWWPWLAWALFSTDATHNIRQVTLDVEGMTMDDFRSMQEVLQHANPLAFLCAGATRDGNSRTFQGEPVASLYRSETHITIRYCCQDAGCNVHRSMGPVRTPLSFFCPIVRDNVDEAFIEVVIPGLGVHRLDRTNVCEIRPLRSRVANSVTTIELQSISPESSAAVLALLGLIGESLESLTLSHTTSQLDDDFMASVCNACPRLKTLRVKSDLVSVRWLLSQTANACTLELLELTGHISNHQSLLELVESLQFVHQSVSRSMRAIHLTLMTKSRLGKTSVMKLCRTWLRMLRMNPRLERCELLVDGFVPTFNNYRKRLDSHRNKKLFGREKCAFLSVLRTDQERDVFPREIVDVIVDMAGIPSTRICW